MIPQDVPGVVHRLQEDLLTRQYSEYIYGLADSMERSATIDPSWDETNSMLGGAARLRPEVSQRFCQDIANLLNITRLFHVSEAMTAVARQAAEQLPSVGLDLHWHPDSFPSMNGLLFFGQGLLLADVWNRPVNVAAVMWSWSPQGVPQDRRPGWLLTLFSDRKDLRDYYFERDVREHGDQLAGTGLGRYLIFEMTFMPVGQPVSPWVEDSTEAVRIFRLEHSVRMPDGEIPEWDHNGPPNTMNLGRINWAIFRLMEQELADLSDWGDRRLARRNHGKKRPSHEVTVIELRRRHHYGEYQEGTGTFLTYRSITSGHWRNQPYGKGRQEVKRIWIHPYVRGPEGAPFHQTTKVNALKR